jgi:hypothetical protein
VSVKFLSDGTPVLVVGDAPPRDLQDGSEGLPQLVVARLGTEIVEATQVHDQKPEPAPSAPAPASGTVTTAPAPPSKAEQLDALHTAGVLSDEEYAAAKERL